MTEMLRITTRKSPLALWQAEFIKLQLQQAHPDLRIELIKVSTSGDALLDTSLSKIGGKGLFVKELEQALARNEADLAVHSVKDVPAELPAGFAMPIICARGNPYDAFVSNQAQTLTELPPGAIIGTSSLRRQAQLLARRPDLVIKPLRGNLQTRLDKLDKGEFNGIILACAGLLRLNLEQRIRQSLAIDWLLPAVGQGALGLEIRAGDARVEQLLGPLYDANTMICVSAERAMNQRLAGGCQLPVAGFATLNEDHLCLEGRVGAPDGSQLLRVIQSCSVTVNSHQAVQQAETLGLAVAEELVTQGANEILMAL